MTRRFRFRLPRAAKGPPPLRPLKWTDEQLDRLSEVTPKDIEHAADWWRRNAPADFVDLLDAEDEDAGA